MNRFYVNAKKHAKELRDSSYVQKVSYLISGNFLAQLIQVITLPIISRLYSPDDFGLFSLFLAFISFSVVALSLKYESALLIAEDQEILSLRAISIYLVLANSFLFTLLLYIFQEFSVLSFELLPAWVPFLLICALIGHGLFNVERAIALRAGNAGSIAKARVEKSLANVLSKIGVGFACVGFIGLLIGEVFGAWFALRRVSNGIFEGVTSGFRLGRKNLLVIHNKYKKFPYLEFPSSIIDQSAQLLPIPMLAVIGGAEVAGTYGMARLIVSLPNAQIGRAIADGYQWKISYLLRDGNEHKLLRTMFKTSIILASIGVVPYALIGVLSPWFFPFVLGEEWRMSGTFASLLSVWMYAAFVVSPISRILSVLKSQEYKLFYDLFVLVSILTLFFIAQSTEMTSIVFVGYLVGINSIGYLVYGVILFFVCNKFVNAKV